MSIFTGTDRERPLLTQYYQLDFDPANLKDSELDQWVKAVIATHYGKMRDETWQERLTKEYGRLATEQSLFKRLMDSAADTHGYAWPDLHDFSVLRGKKPKKEFERFEAIPPEGAYQLVYRPAHVPVGQVHLVKYEGKVVLEPERPLGQLIEEMSAALLSEDPFRRCDECKSSYLVTRKGSRFCSDRCRARQHSRDRWRRSHGKNGENNFHGKNEKILTFA